MPTIKQVSRAYTRLTKTIHPHLGGKFVEERASNVARIVIRAFQQAKRAAELDSYLNAGNKWTSSYEDDFMVPSVLLYSEEELEEERELIKAQEAFEEAEAVTAEVAEAAEAAEAEARADAEAAAAEADVALRTCSSLSTSSTTPRPGRPCTRAPPTRSPASTWSMASCSRPRSSSSRGTTRISQRRFRRGGGAPSRMRGTTNYEHGAAMTTRVYLCSLCKCAGHTRDKCELRQLFDDEGDV